jgi:hypothetical protein
MKMKLYHGTSLVAAKKGLSEGLQPRRLTKHRGNWENAPSSESVVYLTDSYAAYFAISAAKNGNKAAVLEIDLDLFPSRAFKNLVPDEDALEQTGRGHDGIKGDMQERTRYYRRRLPKFCGSSYWQNSLRSLGTCGYYGAMPSKSIVRLASIDVKQAEKFCWSSMGPAITIANQRFVGAKYKLMTRWLFDGPDGVKEQYARMSAFDKDMAHHCLEWLLELPRDGIDVRTIKKTTTPD